jgi:hypothetical protein
LRQIKRTFHSRRCTFETFSSSCDKPYKKGFTDISARDITTPTLPGRHYRARHFRARRYRARHYRAFTLPRIDIIAHDTTADDICAQFFLSLFYLINKLTAINHLKKEFLGNDVSRRTMKNLAALAFIPPQNVIEEFVRIKENASEVLDGK